MVTNRSKSGKMSLSVIEAEDGKALPVVNGLKCHQSDSVWRNFDFTDGPTLSVFLLMLLNPFSITGPLDPIPASFAHNLVPVFSVLVSFVYRWPRTVLVSYWISAGNSSATRYLVTVNLCFRRGACHTVHGKGLNGVCSHCSWTVLILLAQLQLGNFRTCNSTTDGSVQLICPSAQSAEYVHKECVLAGTQKYQIQVWAQRRIPATSTTNLMSVPPIRATIPFISDKYIRCRSCNLIITSAIAMLRDIVANPHDLDKFALKKISILTSSPSLILQWGFKNRLSMVSRHDCVKCLSQVQLAAGQGRPPIA